MGLPQRQEQLDETLYGNAGPATGKLNLGQHDALRLEDLLGDAVCYELADLAEVR